MTLWNLPAETEDQFEEHWQDWLDHVDAWALFFGQLAELKCDDLLKSLSGFELISPAQIDEVSKLRRSPESRAVLLPGIHSPSDAKLTDHRVFKQRLEAHRSEGEIFGAFSRPAHSLFRHGIHGHGRILLRVLIDDPTLGDVQDAVIAASQLKDPRLSFEEHYYLLLRKTEPLDIVAETPGERSGTSRAPPSTCAGSGCGHTTAEARASVLKGPGAGTTSAGRVRPLAGIVKFWFSSLQ